LVYNSDKYLYLLSSNRVSILKLEQETSSDDHIMPSQMNQVEVYPNPFAIECKISMKQTNAKILNVSIYNIKGQKIRDLSNGNLKNEHDQIIWDARDHSNQTVASGIYFVKVETEQGLFVKKILKLK
ncbi:MAG: T9SS type A sorting domain-containing protein, partial [Candidatus Cloacimonetes bacterium]|nr:T9SS type A sorting domain-containing protein [Candidatus Cloacimonadota bacterium]